MKIPPACPDDFALNLEELYPKEIPFTDLDGRLLTICRLVRRCAAAESRLVELKPRHDLFQDQIEDVGAIITEWANNSKMENATALANISVILDREVPLSTDEQVREYMAHEMKQLRDECDKLKLELQQTIGPEDSNDYRAVARENIRNNPDYTLEGCVATLIKQNSILVRLFREVAAAERARDEALAKLNHSETMLTKVESGARAVKDKLTKAEMDLINFVKQLHYVPSCTDQNDLICQKRKELGL